METWQIAISSSSEGLLLLNVVFLVQSWFRLPVPFKYFASLLSFSFLIQLVAHIIWFQHETNKQVNNLYLLHFYTIIEFILISMIYREVFKQNQFLSKYFVLFIGLISGFIIANSIFLQPITVFNSNAKTLTQVIYIAYAVGFFLNATHHQTESYHNVLKTINSAILLYYTGSLFIFMFGNVFFQLDEFHRIFWVANAVLYLIFQLLVFTAIWQFRQTKSTYS